MHISQVFTHALGNETHVLLDTTHVLGQKTHAFKIECIHACDCDTFVTGAFKCVKKVQPHIVFLSTPFLANSILYCLVPLE